MSGDIVLNIAEEGAVPATPRRNNLKKGGRWTDRVKAKRTLKRKERPETTGVGLSASVAEDVEDIRPSKKPRKESVEADIPRPKALSSTCPHIVSSLFSYNPKVSTPKYSVAYHGPSKPSNAPIETTTFEGLGISPLLVSHLSKKMNITQPTSVQRAALPSLLKPSEMRDVFIQSQTGSGKTLSFLLPIIQDLLPLSSLSYIDRSIGTLAIIIAPTRELAKQIYGVLETILTLRLRPTDDPEDLSPDSPSPHITRWLVPGLLTGGATRTHEKARLRKGIPILVSTPGRLLDHLQNTSAFNIEKCKWLVLDEADRLMDLGFEETIRGILKNLDGRRKLAIQAEGEGKGTEVPGLLWNERRNVLCSATIREDVQMLAGVALKSPMVIKAQDSPVKADITGSDTKPVDSENFTPPSQLAQNFVVVPLKLRLVTLVALLRHLLTKTNERAQKGTKIIVFMTCTDSVDFHWNLLGGAVMDGEEQQSTESLVNSAEDLASDDETGVQEPQRIQLKSPLLPDTSLYRLHGSLSLQTRLAALKAFSSKTASSGNSSVLLCTSVASRGLDLPLVRAVIQHDLPTEGGATEYVHRVGRTARVGKGGEAWAIVAPSEEDWVPWVEERMGDDTIKVKLQSVVVETILRDGFGGKGKEYEARATQVQLSFERWVLGNPSHSELARKAFVSHIRAYATHPLNEKHMFHVRHLHLGHLAKAFALREAPNAVVERAGNGSRASKKRPRAGEGKAATRNQREHSVRAEKRMTAAVRSQGRLSKKRGIMMMSDASEFQVASVDALEKIVHR